MLSILPSILSTLFLSFFILSPIAQAFVPPSSTFKYVNKGDFDIYAGEYSSNYRYLHEVDSPKWFGVFFYNNTPNAYTLAIGMGFSPMWVWAANRAKPVHEGATLTFGKDGNLVLADVDRKIVWQTNTANKGVVGIKLLESGNLVLYNAKGKFVWQSFDHPTDTLLPGQSLRAGLADKLVSRASTKSSQEGPYSLIMRPNRVSMYYKSNKSPNLLQYNTMLNTKASTLKELKFVVQSIGGLYELDLEYSSKDGVTGATHVVTSTKYNSTLSCLRLDYDGNLRAYSFYDQVPDGVWTIEFTMFTKDDSSYNEAGNECQLPNRCGEFGLCYKDQCVACPSSNGLLGWTENCQPPKLGGCGGGKNVKYYKIEGVEHFTSKYTKGEGPMKEVECGTKCTKDCKCLGYFYHQESSRCWVAYDLKTLTKSGNNKHLGYIKYSG